MKKRTNEALDFIEKKANKYNPDIALTTSFGKDSIVVMDLVKKVQPNIPMLFVKPPFLPNETIELADKYKELWDINLKVVESRFVDDEEFMDNVVREKNLPKNNPTQCCQIFKVDPLMRKVCDMDLEAWFSGLRNTESEKRNKYTEEWEQEDFVKLHPILEWTEEDVWNYIRERDLPYHPWYDEGYRSIGCAPCSSPAQEEEDERAGRWRDTMKQGGGCGIHSTPMKK